MTTAESYRSDGMGVKYRKIDPRMWKDEGFTSLKSAADKLLAVYCITAQSNRIGIFIFSPALAAEDLEIPVEDVKSSLKNVCAAFDWVWEESTRLLFIPTWWKYNHPENANVLKGCLDDVHDLPKSELVDRFHANMEYLSEGLESCFGSYLEAKSGKFGPTCETGRNGKIGSKVRSAVKSRDKSRCRYCGTLVDWDDNCGPNGGTYDHVNPYGHGTLDNTVTACRSCNTIKNSHSLEASGLVLMAAPTDSGLIPKQNGGAPPDEGLPPLPFSSPEFAEAWSDWIAHRKEKRAPIKPTMAKSQFKKFAEWGETRSIAAIRYSIFNGWQGMFEPTPGKSNSPDLMAQIIANGKAFIAMGESK